MHDIADRLLDAADAAGAMYADCRVVQRSIQSVTVKNGRVNNVSQFEDEGCGIRVLVDGAWGFCGTQRTDAAGLEDAARLAVRIARASARSTVSRVRLAPVARVTATYTTPVVIDPFAVPLNRKIDLLLAADAGMDVAGVTTRLGSLAAVRHHQLFASSEGSRIEQTIIETGGGLDATATGDGEVQTRSFPNSFGRQQLAAGWEVVDEMDLAGNATRIAEEAAALLSADLCPAGNMTLILDATQAALQVHEILRPSDRDRPRARFRGGVRGDVVPDARDAGPVSLRDEQVTITADATSPRGLGTFGYDDEGVQAQRTLLVDHGLFTGYLTSRETASMFDAQSGGTVRAESWNRLPMIRMTNINLEPGTSTLDEMVATTEHGVYLETNRSWSIDDRRLNFQFGTQAGWEIRDGRRVRLVRNPLYSGSTPQFWNSCDAVAGLAEWQMFGVINCGKGQPGQVMHVGHGAAPCRFRNVAVRPA